MINKTRIIENVAVGVFIGVLLGLIGCSYIYEYKLPVDPSFLSCEEKDGDLYIVNTYRELKEFYVSEDGRAFDKNQCIKEGEE